MNEDNIDTRRSQHTFSPRAEMGGRPYLLVELLKGRDLPCLGKDGFLTIDMKPGVTPEQAEELAKRMNNLIRGLAYTGPLPDSAKPSEQPPWR